MTAVRLTSLLRTLGGLWKHHIHAAGNGVGQPHDVPDLSASRDRTAAPLHHAVVLDAERQGRACYAMEIDPGYVDASVKRWEDYTGEKATRLDKGDTR